MENNKDTHFKYLIFLSILYATILLMAVLLDYQFILIGTLLASASSFIISLTFFLTDVIAEVYGYHTAKQVIFSGVICLFCFSLISFFFDKLSTPSEYHQYGYAYHIILHLLFRAGIANAAAMIIGALFNIYCVNQWKIIFKGKYFWLRCLLASAIGEAIYTIFVVSLVNIDIVSFHHFTQILIVSYLLKLLFDMFAVIPAVLLATFLKRAENVRGCGFPTHLSPFKV